MTPNEKSAQIKLAIRLITPILIIENQDHRHDKSTIYTQSVWHRCMNVASQLLHQSSIQEDDLVGELNKKGDGE